VKFNFSLKGKPLFCQEKQSDEIVLYDDLINRRLFDVAKIGLEIDRTCEEEMKKFRKKDVRIKMQRFIVDEIKLEYQAVQKLIIDALKEQILTHTEKVDFTMQPQSKYCTVIVGSIDWKFDSYIRMFYKSKRGNTKVIKRVLKDKTVRKIMGWNRNSNQNLTTKERETFANFLRKKLIDMKHKVRLKKVLFKEEGFLENKLKKWKNHYKEKVIVKNPLKRKDKIKIKMKTKIAENLYTKVLTNHYYLKKSPKFILFKESPIIQSRLRNAFRLENLYFKRFIPKEHTSIIELFNETTVRFDRFSLNNLPNGVEALLQNF
jgi:hypothetical protein